MRNSSILAPGLLVAFIFAIVMVLRYRADCSTAAVRSVVIVRGVKVGTQATLPGNVLPAGSFHWFAPNGSRRRSRWLETLGADKSRFRHSAEPLQACCQTPHITGPRPRLLEVPGTAMANTSTKELDNAR